ncbi:FlgD immunoglobulin-like domain containing protein [Gemmatimonadota bacterium]
MRSLHGRNMAITILFATLIPLSLTDRTEAQGIVTRQGEGLARIGEWGRTIPVIPTFTSATPLLDEGQQRLARLAASLGIAAGEQVISAAAVYEVGEVKDFWAVDFSKSLSFPYQQYKVEAECRAVGDYAYYFIESDELLVVGAAALSEFISAFETALPSSPRDPGLGIYDHVTEVFGDVPDIDSDDKIVILLTKIPVEATAAAESSFFSGYFYSVNQFADPVDFGGGIKQNSNHTEMLYVNSQMIGYEDPDDTAYTAYIRSLVKGTIAHEFQHLIQWGNDPDEITAVNEGLAEYSSYITGFGLRGLSPYVTRPNVDLLSWRKYGTVTDDYARLALWTYYLGTRFGDDYILELSTDPLGGVDGIESSLTAVGAPDFGRVFHDFITALYLEGGDLGNQAYDLAPVTSWVEPQVHENLFPSSARVRLEPRGVTILRYWNVTDLALTFPDGLPVGVTASLAKMDPGTTWDIDPLTAAGTSVSGMGITWPEAAVILTNEADNPTDTFRVATTGTQGDVGLVRYETGRPEVKLSMPDFWHIGIRITPEVAPAKITGVWVFYQGDSDMDIVIRTMTENTATPGTWIINNETPIYSTSVSPRFKEEGWLYVPVPDPGLFTNAGVDYLISLIASDHYIGYSDLNRKLSRSFLRDSPSSAWNPLGNYIANEQALLGDWMIRAEFAYQDVTAPSVGVGLIQHPLFPSLAEVYVTGNEPLHHGMSSGTWVPVGGSATDLLFEGTLGGLSIVDPTPVILQAGQIDISVEGFDRYSGLSDTDDLTASVSLLGEGSPAMLISRGISGTVTVDIPPGSHRGTTLVLIPYDTIPDGLPGAPEQEEPVLGAPVVSISPWEWQGPMAGLQLTLPVHGFAREGEDFHFEQWNGSMWEGVPGEVIIERSAARGSISGGGWYRLARGNAPTALYESGVELLGNAPNPFNPRTVISYRVPGSSANQHVRLTVLNVRGQVVRTLVDGAPGVGTHTVTWEGMDSSGRQVATGIYLYRLEVGRTVITRKMLLLR